MKTNLLLAEYAITFFPVILLAILWHELGHVIGARIGGVRLLAWGIGVRKPWFHLRIGSLVFYLGLPFTSGLAIRMFDRFKPNLAGQFILTASGPIASALGAGIGILIFVVGYPSPTLITWIMFSSIIAVTSSIPSSYTIGQIRVLSDGYQCWALYRQDHNIRRQPSAITLAGIQSIYELMTQINHSDGIDNMFLLRSINEVGLGRWHHDDEILNDLNRIDQNGNQVNQSLVSYIRACLAAIRRSEQTEEMIAIARRHYPNDSTAQFILDFNLTSFRHEKGDDVTQEIEHLEQRAMAANNRHLQAIVAFLKLEIQPVSEWNTSQSEAILSQYDGYLVESAVASVLAITTARLSELGVTSGAKNYFQRTSEYVQRIASEIGDLKTRESFIAFVARQVSTTPFDTTSWNNLKEAVPGRTTEGK